MISAHSENISIDIPDDKTEEKKSQPIKPKLSLAEARNSTALCTAALERTRKKQCFYPIVAGSIIAGGLLALSGYLFYRYDVEVKGPNETYDKLNDAYFHMPQGNLTEACDTYQEILYGYDDDGMGYPDTCLTYDYGVQNHLIQICLDLLKQLCDADNEAASKGMKIFEGIMAIVFVIIAIICIYYPIKKYYQKRDIIDAIPGESNNTLKAIAETLNVPLEKQSYNNLKKIFEERDRELYMFQSRRMAFLLGSQLKCKSKIAKSYPIYTHFFKSKIFDRNLLREIFSFSEESFIGNLNQPHYKKTIAKEKIEERITVLEDNADECKNEYKVDYKDEYKDEYKAESVDAETSDLEYQRLLSPISNKPGF